MDYLENYQAELSGFHLALRVTLEVSDNQHGIRTDGRGVRAVRIFTRQTMTGLSLNKLLPSEFSEKGGNGSLYDLPSVASLVRNLIEGYLSLCFFGLESIDDDEAELRFFILQLHRNKEWYEIRKLLNPDDPELKDFKNGIRQEKLRIRNHPGFQKLSEDHRRYVMNGREIYTTKSEFEKKLPECNGLRRDYRLLSNLIHPLPLSIERINNEQGRGDFNMADLRYMYMMTVIAKRYLAASTVGVCKLFLDTLGKTFENEIHTIEPMMFEDVM